MSSSVSTNVLKVKVQSRVVDLDSEKKKTSSPGSYSYTYRHTADTQPRSCFVLYLCTSTVLALEYKLTPARPCIMYVTRYYVKEKGA